MKRLTLTLALLCSSSFAQLGAPSYPTTAKTPSITTGSFAYSGTAANCAWTAQHQDLSTSGVGNALCNAGAVPPTTNVQTWLSYVDSLDYGGNYLGLYQTVYGYCSNASYLNPDCEGIFLHTNRDSYIPSTAGLAYQDMFDWYECTSTGNCNPSVSNSQTIHGIWKVHAGVFTDVTVAAYSGPSVALAAGDSLYIGYHEPYDTVNFTVSSPAVGATLTWQYGTGSGAYTTLSSHLVDGTASFANTGSVTFYPAANWARDTVNSVGQSKYWVKVTSTAAVTFSKIYGDSQTGATACSDCGGNSANHRGWNQTAWAASTACSGAPCTVSTENIAYNPTAATDAATGTCPSATTCNTARFKYQSRWASYGGQVNHFYFNPETVNSNTGHNAMAEMLTYKLTVTNALLSGSNGVMFDNAATIEGVWTNTANSRPTISALIAAGNFDVTARTQSDIDADYATSFDAARGYIHTQNGATFKVYGNSSGGPAVGRTFDLYGLEFANKSLFEPNNLQWVANSLAPDGIDNIIDAANTRGVVSYNQFLDGFRWNEQAVGAGISTYHVYNGGTRLPILGLAQYYMSANYSAAGKPYNGMVWGTSPSASYSNIDQVGVYQTGATGTILTATTVPVKGNGVVADIYLTSEPGFTTVGGTYFANGYEIRICRAADTTYQYCDKSIAMRAADYANPGNIHYQTGCTSVGCAGNVVGAAPILGFWPAGVYGGGVAYQAGDIVQAATTKLMHTDYPTCGSGGACPDPKNVWVWWAEWWPAMAYDIGKPDSTGYYGGVRGVDDGSTYGTNSGYSSLVPAPAGYAGPYLLGSNVTCIGHAGVNGCSANAPAVCSHNNKGSKGYGNVWRRDFTKAIVLIRNYGFDYCDDDMDWGSESIDLHSLQSSCAPNCSYQRLQVDATLENIPITSLTLSASEAAILIPGAAPPNPDSCAVTVPQAGDTKAGTFTVSAACTPGQGSINAMALTLDGGALASCGSSPCTNSLNTNTLSTLDGSHTIGCTGGDTSGGTGTCGTVTFTVHNAIVPSPGVIR